MPSSHGCGGDGIVYFSEEEFDFIKSKRLTAEEFDYCWRLKLEDWKAQIIPDDEKNKALQLAKKYLPNIIGILKGQKSQEEQPRVKPDFRAMKAGEKEDV